MASKRECSRVLLVDEQSRVLMFSVIDRAKPERPACWVPVGGALEPGETPVEAAVRETEEETGLRIADPGPIVFTRAFRWDFEGQEYDRQDWFFLVRVQGFEPATSGWSEAETARNRGTRWWSVEELRSTDELVYPDDLSDELDRLLRRRVHQN